MVLKKNAVIKKMDDWLKKSYVSLPVIAVPYVENRLGTLVNRSPRNIQLKNSLNKMSLIEYITLRDLTWFVEWRSVRKTRVLSNIY